MRLIGLTGRAGCGKDTVGRMLRETGFWMTSFAQPLREMSDVLLEYLGEDCNWFDRAWKEAPLATIGVSPRRVMQTLGTEWGRQMIHPDLWLKCAGQTVAMVMTEFGPGTNIAFTDCRFENEAAWIRAQGGEVWHILRPQIRQVEHHVSEAGIALMPGADSVLDNSGDLDHLADQVRRALAGELQVEDKGAAA